MDEAGWRRATVVYTPPFARMLAQLQAEAQRGGAVEIDAALEYDTLDPGSGRRLQRTLARHNRRLASPGHVLVVLADAASGAADVLSSAAALGLASQPWVGTGAALQVAASLRLVKGLLGMEWRVASAPAPHLTPSLSAATFLSWYQQTCGRYDRPCLCTAAATRSSGCCFCSWHAALQPSGG